MQFWGLCPSAIPSDDSSHNLIPFIAIILHYLTLIGFTIPRLWNFYLKISSHTDRFYSLNLHSLQSWLLTVNLFSPGRLFLVLVHAEVVLFGQDLHQVHL